MGGRVALVTGASRGIGRAVALALAADGHRVAACYGSDAAAAADTRAAIESVGGEAIIVQVDVCDPASVDAAFTATEEAFGGKVEVLVANAGINRDGLLMRMTDDQWSSVLRTNLDGSFHVIRRATSGMVRARWGRIVVIGSVVGLSGSAGQANYAAAKAGQVGLVRAIARESDPQRHREPGGPRTDRHRHDRRPERRHTVGDDQAGTLGTVRHSGGGCRSCFVSLLGRRGLRVRRNRARRRRHGHGSLIATSRRKTNFMDRATVLDELTDVAVEVLGVKRDVVSEAARFKEELDADSLDLVEFVMALEEKFSISVPEDKLEGITTVGEAVDLVIGQAAPSESAAQG